MHSLATIPCARVELTWNHPLSGPSGQRTHQLRGALGNAFRDDPLFHQHDPQTGRVLYRYPRVQYRWSKGHGVILGWAEAAMHLLERPWLDLDLQLGDDPVLVEDAALTLQQLDFAVSDRLEAYHCASPLLLFNQENYQRYQTMTIAEQAQERDRLLVSNLLIALRGLDVEFPQRLYAAFVHCHSRPVYYKGQELVGMSGEFLCNAILPDGFAFGRSVSHGNGWVERASSR